MRWVHDFFHPQILRGESARCAEIPVIMAYVYDRANVGLRLSSNLDGAPFAVMRGDIDGDVDEQCDRRRDGRVDT